MSDVIDIVLMAGQSNMVGWKTSAEDIAAKWRRPIDGAFVWQNSKWEPLQVEGGYQKKGFGPELSFAQQYHSDSGRKLGIVKVAANGSYLSRTWSPDADDQLLDQLISAGRAAMADGQCRLRGLIWMQGEADAIDQKDAKAYGGQFKKLIQKLRSGLGTPNLPVVSGLIDPPVDQCPFSAQVRDALTEHSDRTVPCSGLPKRRDGLHYDPKGLSMLGRRFAKEIGELNDQTSESVVRQWLWSSEQYQVWYEGPEGIARDCVVTFPHAVKDSGLYEEGFGQTYFAKHEIPAVHILSNQSDWFQNDEIFDVVRAVRAYLSHAIQIVSYGASMGAYGALLTSDVLETDKIIAIAPQYSIDRTDVPWEIRWKNAAGKIGRFRHDVNDHISPTARKVVLYDPLSMDRQQVELFASDESWSFGRLPLASHQVLQFLLETKSLPILMEDLLDDGPDLDKVIRHARAHRRDAKLYWLTLANMTADRRPELALKALDRADELGGPKRKLRQIREKIEAAQAA